MEYGYARVSSKEQNEQRQLISLQEFGIPMTAIYVDKQSGKDFNRQSYRRLLRKLKSGDTLVVKSIDRLGRNYDEILEQWRVITKEKCVAIVVLDMPLLDTRQSRDLTGTLIADIVLQLLSYVAMQKNNDRRCFMKTKRLLMMILTLLLIFGLCSCSPKEKSNSEVSADIAAFLEDDYENLNVTDLRITKRATDTDARTDIVYAEIDFETEKAAHTRQYKMEYGLYNDGWILDNVEPYEEETWACSPLYGMSDEELLEMYSSSINNPIDLQIVLNDTDLENGVQSVEYQYVMEYPFCRVTWKCDEQFLFSKDGESWRAIYSSTGGVPYAIKEDWNITGRWTNSGSYYLEYIDIYSSDLASGTVNLFWHYKDEEERLTAPFRRTQSFAVETGLDPFGLL